MRRRRGFAAALALALLAAGCELAEVATPDAADVLVVEAVLRAGAARQNVLLHRSLGGTVVRGEEGAAVSVLTPEGATIRFSEAPSPVCTENLKPERTDSLTILAACYTATRNEGLGVIPGGTYELRVQTRDGRVLRGRTTVPGAFAGLSPPPAALRSLTCRLDPDTPLPLVWSRASGAWSYVAALEILGLREALKGRGIDAPERLELTGLAISETDTTLVLPGEFGLFERAELDQKLLGALQGGLPEGTRARTVVAAADRNYVNAVRGGGFNPSGNVRISSVVGDGVGVFGSIVAREFSIEVARSAPYPSCLPRT